jgi:hypothetical protein
VARRRGRGARHCSWELLQGQCFELLSKACCKADALIREFLMSNKYEAAIINVSGLNVIFLGLAIVQWVEEHQIKSLLLFGIIDLQLRVTGMV